MIARRYLVLVSLQPGTAERMARRVSAQVGLEACWASERSIILSEDDGHCVPLETGEGAFVGTVFTSGNAPSRVDRVPRGMSHAIMDTQGAASLHAYWGGYVLVCDDKGRGELSVARDPSGALPCYYFKVGNVWAFGSDIVTLLGTGLLQATVSFPAISRHLAYPDLRTQETCIHNVADLLPGTRQSVSTTTTSVHNWWSPWAFVKKPAASTFEGCAALLRATVDNCVGAWASTCQRPLLSLSGGLDSSIVASSLTHAGADYSAFTMVGAEADADERYYAYMMAKQSGLTLHEGHYDPINVDLTTPVTAHLPRPLGTAHMQVVERAARSVALIEDNDAFFNGVGGDNVFCALRSALPVADSILTRRPARGVVATIRDVAVLADVGPLAVLRQALRMLVIGRRPFHAGPLSAYLSAKARDAAAHFVRPPWLSVPGTVPPGRANHVEMIARVQLFIDGLDPWSAPPTIVPLLSQPILELCIGIPSWYWVKGGLNRAAARRAFTNRLPSEVATRSSKGGPDTMSLGVCLDNLTELRSRLLHGILVSENVIDPKLLDPDLTEAALLSQGSYHGLLRLADVEAWIRHWQSRDQIAQSQL